MKNSNKRQTTILMSSPDNSWLLSWKHANNRLVFVSNISLYTSFHRANSFTIQPMITSAATFHFRMLASVGLLRTIFFLIQFYTIFCSCLPTTELPQWLYSSLCEIMQTIVHRSDKFENVNNILTNVFIYI